MEGYYLKVREIPPMGRELLCNQQEIWRAPIEEFSLPYTIEEPLIAHLRIMVEEECCLIKGHVGGGLIIPCDRCGEDAHIRVDASFNIVEEVEDEKSFGPSFLIEENGELLLDIGGILWEQLLLALPTKILCNESCKGLCPRCGSNLNFEKCTCPTEVVDPRLEVLKNLKIS